MGRRHWAKNARRRERARRLEAHESYLRHRGEYLAAAKRVYDEIEEGKLANTPEERVRRFSEVYTEVRGKNLTLDEIEVLLAAKPTGPAAGPVVVADDIGDLSPALIRHMMREPPPEMLCMHTEGPGTIVETPFADLSNHVVIHTPRFSPVAAPDNFLPEAHGGCQCMCHRSPGIVHCVPCCRPAADIGLAEFSAVPNPPQGCEVHFEHTDDSAPPRLGECSGADQVQGDGVP